MGWEIPRAFSRTLTYFPYFADPLRRDGLALSLDKREPHMITPSHLPHIFAHTARTCAHAMTLSLTPLFFPFVQLRDFQRNGLALPLEKRDHAKELKKKISELSIEYQKRLNEDVSEVTHAAHMTSFNVITCPHAAHMTSFNVITFRAAL